MTSSSGKEERACAAQVWTAEKKSLRPYMAVRKALWVRRLFFLPPKRSSVMTFSGGFYELYVPRVFFFFFFFFVKMKGKGCVWESAYVMACNCMLMFLFCKRFTVMYYKV